MAKKKPSLVEKTHWQNPKHPNLLLNLDWITTSPYKDEKVTFLGTYKLFNKTFKIKEYFTLHQTLDNGLFEIYININ
jgi:hypothetical protein